MWAVIGVYGGREDNMLWRRCRTSPTARSKRRAPSRCRQDAQVFGPDVIHSVVQSIPRVHRRDPCLWRRFLRRPAQRMGSESLCEKPYDVEKALRMFKR